MIVENRGAALVGVVWVTLLLTILALGVLNLSLANRKMPQSVMQRIQAEYLADSTGLLYLKRHIRNDANQNILAKNIQVMGTEMSVSIELEDAKIDLNKASHHLLSAALAYKGFDVATAESVADAIIDWRDDDDLVIGNGAEAETYQTEGLSYGPRNGPFETIGELSYVWGVTPNMARCLRPILTVYSSPNIMDVDLGYASAEVLAVFDWARENGWHGKDWSIPEETPLTPPVLDLSSRAISLNVMQAGDPKSLFSKIVRIKSSTPEEITYSVVKSLTKAVDSAPCVNS